MLVYIHISVSVYMIVWVTMGCKVSTHHIRVYALYIETLRDHGNGYSAETSIL